MTTPISTGRLISLNPTERNFFDSNQYEVKKFLKNETDDLVNKVVLKDNKISNISDIKTCMENKLKSYNIKFDSSTEHFKSNILSTVLSCYWEKHISRGNGNYNF